MNSRVDVLLGATRVSPNPRFQLRVELRGGESIILDLEKLIQHGEVYRRLRQPHYFSMVSVDPLGGICWSEGEHLAPDGLDRYMVSQG